MSIKSHGFTTGPCLHTSRIQQKACNHFDTVQKRAILVIRNPFKALIGHRNLDAGGHTGFAKRTEFMGDGWNSFVKIKINSWENFYLDWLEEARDEDILVLHFENLQSSLLDSLEQIRNYINRLSPLHQSKDEGRNRMICTLKHSEGKFHRTDNPDEIEDENTQIKRHSKYKKLASAHNDLGDEDPFTPEQKDLIKKSIHRVSLALEMKGKKPLPLHKYQFY